MELIQRKRGKKRCTLFRPPEKTQRIRVKLFVPTAQLPSLSGMAAFRPSLLNRNAGQTVDAHCHISVATSHSQSVRLFICAVFVLFSLSQAVDTQGQTRQNRFLLNFLANSVGRLLHGHQPEFVVGQIGLW